MARTDYTREQVVRDGQRIYEDTLRNSLETRNEGRFLVINVETGDYVMGEDDVATSEAAHQRFPGAPLFAMRIGDTAPYHVGAGGAPR